MQVIYPICAGLDVHKKDVKACLVWRDARGQRQQEVRTFGTTTGEILQLADWLAIRACPIVAIESTGVYWKPLYNLLENEFEVLLVNPSHLKHVQGRKTDVKDAAWLAELLEHGLLKPSFIPPREIRDARDLTRYRRRLIQERAAEINRIQKVLEDANIKLASVATSVVGVSGRAMLEALLAGTTDPAVLAELAKGRLRSKREALTAALEGRFRPHHVGLLRRMLEHLDFLDDAIAELDGALEELLRPFQAQVTALQTIPGVDQRGAQEILAEVGADMTVFPSQRHLGSWSGVSPGNNESGGKRKNGKTKKGNKWLRALLVQLAHAAGRTTNTYLGTRYRRLTKRKGGKRAAVAIAHDILDAVYFILRDGVEYQDLGADYFDRLQHDQLVKYHTKRLRELGFEVVTAPTAVAA
jgi:transposase